MATDIQIDPRGPRFGAAWTLLLAVLAMVIGANSVGLVLAFALAALFLPGAIVGPQATVQSAAFKKWVRPRLAPPGGLSTAPRISPAAVRWGSVLEKLSPPSPTPSASGTAW